MGKDAPTPPPAPDPNQLMQSQARMNRIDQFTPFGSLTYSGPDRNVATLSLSPEMQGIVGQQQGISSDLLSRAVAGLEGVPMNPFSTDFSGDIADVERATFDRAMGLLDPVVSREREALQQSLSDRGLPIGSEAYGGEFDRFDRRVAEARQNAAMDAVLAGRQEHSRLIDAMMKARTQPYNEVASLLGMQQVQAPTLGSFVPPSAVDVTGPYQLAQNAGLAEFQAASDRQAAGLGGLFELGGAFLGAPGVGTAIYNGIFGP